MFKELIISNPGSVQAGRGWYFLISSLVLCIALVAGLIIDLFSKDLTLSSGDFELEQLITPVEQPVDEPEPPAPEEPSQRPRVNEPSTPKTTPQRVKRARSTRRVNMARLNETPPDVPKVSTRPNTYAARPANKYFELGKLDLDHGAGYAPGRIGNGGTSSGSGSNPSAGREGVASIKRSAPPPPPPVKKRPKVKKSIVRSLGVINGNATRLPKPRYPATAKAVGVRGKVNVRVLISEKGVVVSADAVSGHPLLRNAAEVAAREARFSPTLLSGLPVKVSGVIVYNFLG